MFSLVGKQILITGASSGIGEACAIVLSKKGATLTLLGRSVEKLQIVLNKLDGFGHDVYTFDLNMEDKILEFAKISKKFDGVVFNAGFLEYRPVKFIRNQDINKLFQVNFNSVVILNQSLLENNKINNNSSLVFISSISRLLGISGSALYSASKSAISSYSKVLASEVAKKKIRSNCISPGLVNTKIKVEIDQFNINENQDDYPLGYGVPFDIAYLALYLLSEESKWMTGSDIVIDGGFNLK